MTTPLDLGARMYCDEADVTTRIDLTDLPGVNLEYLIQAVTRRIERATGRTFQRVPATAATYETRHFLGDGTALLSIDDLLELNSLTVDDDAVDDDDLLLMPFGKTPTTWIEYEAGGTWTPRVDVAISGAWGYSEDVPWDIWDACVVLCVRALQQAKAAYQDASAVPEMGRLVYALAMPKNVKETLDMLRRTAI